MSSHRKDTTIRLDDRQRKLVEDNIGLVGCALSRYWHRGVGYVEDAFQIGLLGLIRAAAHYDSGRGAQFSTYAMHCILSELKQEHRRMTRLKRSGAQVLSLDFPCSIIDEMDTCLAEQIPGDECDIEEQLVRLDLVQRLLRMLERDPSRSARIAFDYFTTTDSQRMVAHRHGVSQAHASACIRRAVRQLRKQLAAQGEVLP
ncbi:sigma-70 family RNA polymerase sigma factor [Eubacteriales bacterium OttesenSCG-928-N13]|nr:sigma-70 family RNA polymerase sigma factor [Eubacteriales bacterium OttesenSCG-928-N13]